MIKITQPKQCADVATKQKSKSFHLFKAQIYRGGSYTYT